ncbi:NADH dehydrogenase (ubiquinone) Fe-S protein 6 [Azospirillaceae bacterium]
MSSVELITVETSKVSCDGGGGPLGHPKIYLKMSQDGRGVCPYCGSHYGLKAGAKLEGGGH